jgi:signal transduction histidine kinase
VIESATTRLEQDLAQHLSGESLENMQLIRGRVRRMNKLLEDLMAYSCIGSAYDQGLSAIVSGDILIGNILSSLKPPDGIALIFDDGFSALRVRLMPLQLLLTKLIDNAVKHHDKKLGRIEIGCQTMGRVHRFSVKDDGPGIRPEFHDRIFRKFQTLKPRDQVEGSGMGLAFVRRIIHDHGQTITLESQEGGGSDFRFSWPIEDDDTTAATSCRK